MVVLALFESRFVTELHCLMWTEMHACQAALTAGAIDRTLVHHLDIFHWTHFCADTAPDTFVRVNLWAQRIEDHLVKNRNCCQTSG